LGKKAYNSKEMTILKKAFSRINKFFKDDDHEVFQSEIQSEIDNLVSNLIKSKPMNGFEDIYDLVDRALDAQGNLEAIDVDNWAKTIAEDVKDGDLI